MHRKDANNSVLGGNVMEYDNRYSMNENGINQPGMGAEVNNSGVTGMGAGMNGPGADVNNVAAGMNANAPGTMYNSNVSAYTEGNIYMAQAAVNTNAVYSDSIAVGNDYSAGAEPYATVNADVKKTEAVAEKKEKKNKGAFVRFLGKTVAIVAAGLLFGLCAAAAFSLVNYYTQKNALVENTIDTDSIKKDIEEDILSKLADKEISGDKIVIDSVESGRPGVSVADVSSVVESVMPSVVSINNSYEYKANYWGREYSSEAEASGSGIIIGENGEEYLIATNNHVIEDAKTLTVVFIDGAECQANVKGADADIDIAVIAVKKESLEASTRDAISIATLGDSDKLTVGEPAIAIGNALGYGQSVTTGVISALDRSLELEPGKTTEGFIQTDAAINPGNSGGALLNAKGEVIGINSNKMGGSAVEGMGYAIPISRALPIINNLKDKKTKEVVPEGEKGYLGISGRGVSAEMAEIYDFPEGVYIYEVYPNTGAEAAKLRKGDIITKFEGSTINSMEKLQEYLAYYEAGETVELTVQRINEDGVYEEIQVSIVLVEKSLLPSK